MSASHPLPNLHRLEPTEVFFADVALLGIQVIPVGPFRIILDPDNDAVWANEAVPVDPLGRDAEVLEHLHELRRVFERRGRTPQVELNEPVWPRLPELLRRAGFVESERQPLMLCTPESFRPFTNPDVHVRFLQPDVPDADVIAYQTIFSEVLAEENWNPTSEAIARFRVELERAHGRSHALAELEGKAAGTGHISSTNGVAEIARIATVPEARQRGVAATLTTFMIQDRFAGRDTLAWLSAEDSRALYDKLGFQLVGARLAYIVEP